MSTKREITKKYAREYAAASKKARQVAGRAGRDDGLVACERPPVGDRGG
jgi:hypothetical protein